MRHISTKAILLKRIEYGEADRIITAITPDKGKVQLFAKGIRRSKSKLAGGLELFSVTHITYIDGKSDLKTIIGTKLEVYFKNIVENIDSTMLAYDFLRLSNVYTEDEADSTYFSLLYEGLSALNEAQISNNHVEAWFLANLLISSGHGLNIDYDLAGNKFSETARYHFSYDDMCFFPHEAGAFSPRHIKFLRLFGKSGKPTHVLRVEDSDELVADLLGTLRKCMTT